MQVIITPKALRHYEKLPKVERAKIKRKLQVLEADALVGKKLVGELAEVRSIKAWPYRIFYYIDEAEKVIYITSILHRQGAYK